MEVGGSAETGEWFGADATPPALRLLTRRMLGRDCIVRHMHVNAKSRNSEMCGWLLPSPASAIFSQGAKVRLAAITGAQCAPLHAVTGMHPSASVNVGWNVLACLATVSKKCEQPE